MKKYTVKSDQAADRKAGIKEGSKKDIALDKKRGVYGAEMKAAHKKAKK